jgi:hypothetical protein
MEVIAMSVSATLTKGTRTHTSTEDVWTELDRASFAVIGYVTPAGEPRSSGVVYKAVGRRLFTVVAADSWKARHIVTGSTVSVTVPVRRGGVLSLVMPIPPATISFHATAIVHPAGAIDVASLSPELESLLPPERRDGAVVIELVPEDRFLTYGVGTALMDMRAPGLSRAVVPVRQSQVEG